MRENYKIALKLFIYLILNSGKIKWKCFSIAQKKNTKQKSQSASVVDSNMEIDFPLYIEELDRNIYIWTIHCTCYWNEIQSHFWHKSTVRNSMVI
jgi:hypothetical protein